MSRTSGDSDKNYAQQMAEMTTTRVTLAISEINRCSRLDRGRSTTPPHPAFPPSPPPLTPLRVFEFSQHLISISLSPPTVPDRVCPVLTLAMQHSLHNEHTPFTTSQLHNFTHTHTHTHKHTQTHTHTHTHTHTKTLATKSTEKP